MAFGRRSYTLGTWGTLNRPEPPSNSRQPQPERKHKLGPKPGSGRSTTFNPQWRQIAPPVGTLQGQAHRPPPGARAVERLASQGPMGSNPRGTRPGRGHSVEKSFFKRLFSRPPDRWFKRRRRAQFLVATNSSTLSDAARPPQCTLPPIARQVRARDRSVGARKGDCWPPQNVAAYLSI